MLNNQNGSGFYMPVAPAYGGNGGFGFGGDGAWIFLWVIAMMFGGWGGMGFGGMGGMGYDFPWLLAGQNQINANTNSGFDHAATQSTLGNIQTAITGGFGDLQTALCGGFAGVNASVNGAQNALAQQLYSNQMSDLERSFAAQTASTQGMTSLASQLANCCCENRLGIANLGADIARENCADRAAVSDALNVVRTDMNAGFQSIKDQMCQNTITELTRENNHLRDEATRANIENYVQNALTAQTQYFLGLYPPPAAAARTSTTTG